MNWWEAFDRTLGIQTFFFNFFVILNMRGIAKMEREKEKLCVCVCVREQDIE